MVHRWGAVQRLRFSHCEWYRYWGQVSKNGLGSIRDIYFKNIIMLGESPGGSQILGTGPESMLEDITFENFRIDGEVIHNAEEGNFEIGKFTRNIVFVPPTDP